MQENDRKIGNVLRQGLEALAAKYPAIGDVRGAKLFIGVEIVVDRA